MADSEDRDLEDLQHRAIELRQQGIRATEISEILNSGHSPWVIRKWLWDFNANPDVHRRVVKLFQEKETDEIAAIMKLSRRRVQWILQHAGISQRQHRTTEQNVDLFLADPELYMTARFTQSEPFGWALLRRDAKEMARNPIDSLRLIEVTKRLLDRIWRTRRKEKTKRQALCLYIQAQGLEARVYELTNRHEVALRILQASLQQSDHCISCEATHLWRFSVLYLSWKKWENAYSALQSAEERYRALESAGHDLLGNGLANCMVVSSSLHYHTVSPEAGAAEARKGLALLTGKESPVLFRNLVFALAKCLQPSRNPRDVQESHELLEWCFDTLDMANECSVARVMLYWLKGHLAAAVAGPKDDAIEYLTYAFEDAQELKLEQEVSAILSDIGALKPDPLEIRNHIEDFCDWSAAGDLIVPAWCRTLQHEIQLVYDISLNTRGPMALSVFAHLREAAGGENIMPALITPAQATPDYVLFPTNP